jgi:hypothetical protein
MTTAAAQLRARGCWRAAFAALAGLALCLVAAPGALADNVQSSNWAGYAVHHSGVKFKQASGSWRQPTATCTPGRATYSSVWVGLGGYSESSNALEQIGSEVDCNVRGKLVSSVWYELVPAASRTIRMQVRPGDMLKATVTLVGHQTTLELRDLTKRHSFKKTLHVSSVDVTSAEWILETPSVCTGGFSCQVLPLADFGQARVTGASATTTKNVSGPIADRAWDTTKITLSAGGHRFIDKGSAANRATASPSALSSHRNAFAITYQGSPTSTVPTASVRRASVLRAAPLTRPALARR